LVQWNNCAGCMGKRSLLSEQPSYILHGRTEALNIVQEWKWKWFSYI